MGSAASTSWGGHCDGLMNYPFRNSLLAYLMGGNAEDFRSAMETIRENYPPFAWRTAMNFLGPTTPPASSLCWAAAGTVRITTRTGGRPTA